MPALKQRGLGHLLCRVKEYEDTCPSKKGSSSVAREDPGKIRSMDMTQILAVIALLGQCIFALIKFIVTCHRLIVLLEKL